MTQSWKNWSWKLGFGIAVATSSVLVSWGDSALAQYQIKPVQREIIRARPIQQPIIRDRVIRDRKPNKPRTTYQLAPYGRLRLTSIRSDDSSNASGRVSIIIPETGRSPWEYQVSPGTEVPISVDGCFQGTATVQVRHPGASFGQRPVTFLSASPSQLVFSRGGNRYTLNYEVIPYDNLCQNR